MKHGSLFSGIGGFDLAAEWMGWENVFHCEWNPFGQKILKYYWPNAKSYEDITKSDFTIYRGEIDILTGGFPCQPYSLAGKRKGKEDERHLWPEMLRAIREIQPRWIVGENVFGLVNWSGGLVFHEVQADLEAEGYEVQSYVLPAAAVNAPHRRDRIWFVAYAKCSSNRLSTERRMDMDGNILEGRERKQETNRFDLKHTNVTNTNCNGFNECNSEHEINTSEGRVDALSNADKSIADGDTTNTKYKGLEGQHWKWERCTKHRENEGIFTRSKNKFNHYNWEKFPTIPPICNGDDGLSNRLDNITFPKWRNESIKAGGNAIVPQVVYEIFKAIESYEYLQTTHQDAKDI